MVEFFGSEPADRGNIFLCHGTPLSDNNYLLETVERHGIRPATAIEIEARLAGELAPLIACGHTHVPRVVSTSMGQLIVNPGSVGLPAYDDNHPFSHVVETGSPNARYAIAEQVQGGWIVSSLSVPYDHRSMAKLARLRGRSEWERALLTGYIN